MKAKFSVLVLAFLVFSSTTLANASSAEQLAAQAASEDHAAAMSAIRELRTMGSTGLDALFVRYAAEIERFSKSGEADENWRRIANAIDTVAMQKDAYASHLYWHTDLATAKRVAAVQGKPILTLRLLGNLNEEFSCANSRLFRAVLYPNADISKYLRDNYILHWQSVRPAPRITIDFGDGRKIERTITGNSIHYILDHDGEVIDALPGLYSPFAFKKYLTQANEMNKILKGIAIERHALALMKYRKIAYGQIIQKRSKGVAAAGVELKEPVEQPLSPAAPGSVELVRVYPTAMLAAPRAAVKMVVTDEYSILRVYDDFAKFEPSVRFDDWNKLAKLYSPNLAVDDNSVAFIRRQNGKTGLSEADFGRLFGKLNTFIALDTTRNDFLYHAKLYEWLNDGSRGRIDLESFNSRVYDQIFQTPDYDKWLGLYSPDVYTALDGNGISR